MTAGPWLVPIVSLRRVPGSQRRERRSGRLGELRVADVAVPADAEVDVDVTLTSASGAIEAAGSVSAPWQGACRRCLRPVAGRLEVQVRELYQNPAAPSRRPEDAARPGRREDAAHVSRPGGAPPGGPGRGRGGAAALAGRSGVAATVARGAALDDGADEETYPLGADHLDLEPLARDALLLALPLAPLCRPDCPGLCPTCGADLAGGPCGCTSATVDPRWAALDALRPPDGAN